MKKFFAIVAFLMVFFSSFSGMNKVESLSFNLKATPECGYITLEWEPVTGADRYYIYRGPGYGLEYETPLTDFPIEETTYKDVTDLVVNQNYCYYVKAVNQEGREFLQSVEACAFFTCQEEIPEIGDEDCKLVLKYQVGNFYYWRNENQKGPMDVEPVLLNSRVLASARYLAEEVGATVGWDGATRTVSIVTLDGNKIQMQIGNPIMLVNGQQVQIDPNNKAVTPIIYKNRTMLPFRALAYNLGATGPDDIVWLGDIKTAVLTFNDGNCNWICGCYKPYVSPTAAITAYQFYKGCDDANKMNVTIPPTMKDKLHGWLFADYIKQHPNSPKWCVEVRLDKDGTVIAWRARPDQYPDCCKPKDCKWVCGCVVRWTEAPNNHISIYFSVNCKHDNAEPMNFIVPMSLKDTSLGLTLLEYFRKYGNQNYWCLEICVDVNRKVVQWKATPEKYPDCCKEEPKWLCGCVIEVKTPAATTNLNYLYVTFILDCNSVSNTALTYTIPISLKDLNLGLTISEYLAKYPDHKKWCVEMVVENNTIVQWKATPEKYPDCCKPADCKWICGCFEKYDSSSKGGTKIWFSPNCNSPSTSWVEYFIPWNLEDLNHQFTIGEYIDQYPSNKVKYWCLEVCVDNQGKVVQWKATPEKYPDCCKPADCKWICGCVRLWTDRSSDSDSNFFEITFDPDCDDDGDSFILSVPITAPDSAYGYTFMEYFRKYKDQKYWCLELCLTEKNYLVSWKATPEKYPDCCKPVVDCRALCGCILGVEMLTDTKALIKFSLDCDQTNVINLIMDAGLLDTQFQLHITDYLKKFPDQKYWCAIMCVGRDNEVVKWTATPEKYPDCCKPALDCKEVCGCILAVDPIAGTNKTEVLFSPNCDPNNVMNLVMLGNILDSQFGISISDYIKKYPNQKYWCAKLCLIEDTEIIKWTATPEKYPDCCKEEGGRIVAYFPEKCIAGTGVLIYNTAGEVVWKGEPNGNGMIDTGCILKCLNTYTVVPVNQKCTFTPPKQEVKVLCCPEKTEIKFDCNCEPLQKLCCCVVRMTIDPDNNGNYSVYLKKDCSSGDPVYDLVLLFPSTLLDTQMGLTILQYYQSIPPVNPPKMGCIEVAYNSSSQVVSWGAYPDRSPCCGEEGGRLVVYMPTKCIKGTTVYVYDVAGAVVWSGSPNSDGMIDTGCKLKCPATYVVVPKNENCTFKPEKQEVKVPCCPEKAELKFDCTCESDYGRIKITVPSDCAPSTYFTIYDYETGNIALKLSPADYTNGVFDTGCKLPCGKAYKIMPINDKCKLTPEAVIVKCPCCPEFGQATFTVSQTETNGRIVGYVPGTCVKGTRILVADMDGNIVWSGTPNDNGYFDTGCTIKCGVSYQVIPKNTGFTFTPEYKEIKLPCCPEKVEVKFECAQKKGRVLVNIPRDCVQGSTLVWVFDVEPTATAKPLGAIMMDNNYQFDSECTLECGKTYWLMPENQKCKFYPAYQKVTLPCCPEYAKVDFKCECETPKGRIRVSLPKNCIEGTKVLIYEGTSTLVANLTVNDLGYFDTDCILKCDTYYTIIPKNEKCKFSPESQYVKTFCCPEINSITFQCDCQTEKARIVCNIPANCATNTKVLIYNAAGNLAATLSVNAVGVFDSGCTLECNSSYTVVPKNEKCKFYPESQAVRTTCCPETTTVTFKCECESANARIIITVPTVCSASTTVYVYEGEYSANKRAILSLNPDRSGKCDTGCVLKCNTLYTIVPKNANCTFYPATSPVKTTCCPEASTVAFKCECEGPGSIPPEEKVSSSFRQPRCVFNKEENLN